METINNGIHSTTATAYARYDTTECLVIPTKRTKVRAWRVSLNEVNNKCGMTINKRRWLFHFFRFFVDFGIDCRHFLYGDFYDFSIVRDKPVDFFFDVGNLRVDTTAQALFNQGQ